MFNKLIVRSLFFLLFLWQPLAFSEASPGPLAVEFISEHNSIQPNQPFWVGFRFQFAEGWHTYWKNPGVVGAAPKVTWHLPEGFQYSSIQWPFPKKFHSSLGVSFGYDSEELLLVKITPPPKLTIGDLITLEADLHWVACKDSCVPGVFSSKLALPVTETVDESSPFKTAFQKGFNKLPNQLKDVKLSYKNQKIELNFLEESKKFTKAYFFPEKEGVIDILKPQKFFPKTNQLALPIKKESLGGGKKIKGVLLATSKSLNSKKDGNDGDDKDDGFVSKAWEIEESIVEGISEIIGIQSTEGKENYSTLLLFAFIGGLILNLMPCVFPVISFKIMGFIQLAREDRKKVFFHGILFSLGILVSFWILTALLLFLQSSGQLVGWGFQLQEPIFVAILSVIFFVFALNLFEVFELGLFFSSEANRASGNFTGYFGSFFSGILATVVATPCSGPFLGVALGAAVLLEPWMALLVFTSMGLGMAFPYLLFSLFPFLLRLFPKPGPWMVTFRQLMGFFLLGTVLWLIWVLADQTGEKTVFLLLETFFSLALACWVYGKWGGFNRGKVCRFIGRLLALVLIIISGSFFIQVVQSKEKAKEVTVEVEDEAEGTFQDQIEEKEGAKEQKEWIDFSPERVEVLIKAKKPFFIDFTAKWCLLCQANKWALNSKRVKNNFLKKGVVFMRADWTKQDPVITEALGKFSRNSVPLYVLYTGKEEKPIILPQVLTSDIIIEYLDAL